MKIFANSKIWKKIVIAMTLIITVTFVKPEPVEAKINAGELLNPINYFVLAVGDGFMDVIQRAMIGSGTTLIRVDTSTNIIDKIKIIIAATVVAVLVIGAFIATGGISAAAVVGVAKTLAVGACKVVTSIGSLGLGVVVVASMYTIGSFLDDDAVFPVYSVTPEQIIRNTKDLPLFGVNFWDPKDTFIEASNYETQQQFEEVEDVHTNKNTVPVTVKNMSFEATNVENTEFEEDLKQVTEYSVADFQSSRIKELHAKEDGKDAEQPNTYYLQSGNTVYKLIEQLNTSGARYTLEQTSYTGNIESDLENSSKRR